MREDLRIRGYVTPEDFTGTDTEKCQMALDTAEAEDIRKVVFAKEYKLKSALLIPTQTEVVLKKGACLSGKTVFVNKVATEEGKNSWSFEDKLIYIKGEKGAVVKGEVSFYHAKNVVLDGVTLDGELKFEFCREVRMENCTVKSEKAAGVTVMRGSNNFICQYNAISAKKQAVLLSAALAGGEYVVGKDKDIHEMIFKDNKLSAETGFCMKANETDGLFNVQIDHNKVTGQGLLVGGTKKVPKERFFNLTATDFAGGTAGVVLKNETKHCYFGE